RPDRSTPGQRAPASRLLGRPVSKGRPKRGRSEWERARRASPTSSSSTTRPGEDNPISALRAARGTVGEGAAPVDSTAPPAEARPEAAGAGVDGFVPLTLEEARALMTGALAEVDRSALLAERAEAEAQLRAAEATLGNPPAATESRPGEERGPAGPNSDDVDQISDGSTARLDVAELRRAAACARAADDVLARG